MLGCLPVPCPPHKDLLIFHDSAASQQQLREGPPAISPLQVTRREVLVLSPGGVCWAAPRMLRCIASYPRWRGTPRTPERLIDGERSRSATATTTQTDAGDSAEAQRGLQGSTALPWIGQCIVGCIAALPMPHGKGPSEWQPPEGARRCVAILLVSSGAALTCDCTRFGLRRGKERRLVGWWAGGLPACPLLSKHTRFVRVQGGIEGLKPRWSARLAPVRSPTRI